MRVPQKHIGRECYVSIIAMETAVSSDIEERRALIRETPLFRNLSEGAIDLIARYSEFRTFPQGSIIFRQGHRASGIYVIREGDVSITKEEDGGSSEVARFIRGESFGELDLLGDRPLSATAVAEAEAVLLVFPRAGTLFGDIMSRHPTVSVRVIHGLLAFVAGRIRETNRLLSEKAQWVEGLKRQLYIDRLTGLHNRAYLQEELRQRFAEGGIQSALIMLKPDNFKVINDTYGHEAGDRVLKLIAYAVASQIREGDLAARYRGDEFAVFLPDTDEASAMKFAEGMRDLMTQLDISHLTGGSRMSITASLGMAIFPTHGRDAAEMIRICFTTMFKAREAGGNLVLPAARENGG